MNPVSWITLWTTVGLLWDYFGVYFGDYFGDNLGTTLGSTYRIFFGILRISSGTSLLKGIVRG